MTEKKSIKDLEYLCYQAAQVVEYYGDSYLPIFQQRHADLEKAKRDDDDLRHNKRMASAREYNKLMGLVEEWNKYNPREYLFEEKEDYNELSAE